MITIRVSSLPILMICGGRNQQTPADRVQVDTSGPEAALGTAVHEVMAKILNLNADELPPANLPDVAASHSVSEKDLAILSAAGLKQWREIRTRVSTWEAERYIFADIPAETGMFRADKNKKLRIAGNLDAAGAVDEDSAFILDWKTGYKDRSYYHQTMGYAWLLANTDPNLRKITAYTCWLRLGQYDTLHITRQQLDNWYYNLESALNWDGTYRAGEHCTYCPHWTYCKGRSQWLRASSTDIQAIVRTKGTPSDLLARMDDPEQIPLIAPKINQIMDAWKEIERRGKAWEQAVRAKVIEGNLELPCEDPEYVRKIVTREMPELNTEKALEVLRTRISPNKLLDCCKIQPGKLWEVIGKLATTRWKARTIERTKELLTKHGAMTTKSVPALTKVKIDDATATDNIRQVESTEVQAPGSEDDRSNDEPVAPSGKEA